MDEVVSQRMENILKHTKDPQSQKIAKSTYNVYRRLDKKFNSNLSNAVIEEFDWMAESTKDPKVVKKVADTLMMDDVIDVSSKYTVDVNEEIFTNICWALEGCMEPRLIKNYVAWLNNGHMSDLLKFASNFSDFDNIKTKKDIFSIMPLEAKRVKDFDDFAYEIDKKRYAFQKRIQLYGVLKEILNADRKDYAETLVRDGMDKLSQDVSSDLGGLRIMKNIDSVKCGVLLTKEAKNDPSVDFMIRRKVEHGSIKKWMNQDETIRSVIGEMKKMGIDTDMYVASGAKVMEDKIEGAFFEDWTKGIKRVMTIFCGSKRYKIPAKLSVKGVGPGKIFSLLKQDYMKAMKDDKAAGIALLAKLKGLLRESYDGHTMPSSIKDELDDIETLEKVMEFGGVVSMRGAKVIAKVWKRRVPEDLFNSETMRCCIYLPNGEMKQEIPLFMMDPKTTMLQYYFQGMDECVSAATLYAGVSEGKPTLFMDTWDGGMLTYAALGNIKMKEFVLKSMKKFARKVGAKRLLIFTGAVYGRPEEFCLYLKEKEMEAREVEFEAVDQEDSVLARHSLSKKRHYTDAFEWGAMKGKVKAFVIDF